MVTTMESYLMMLYVTLEQESALKNFFVDQGWAFCKPDLSVTTDRVGPIGRKPHVIKKDVHAIRTHPQIEQTVPTIKIALAESKAVTKDIPKPSGKRKAISKRLSIKSPKQAKIMSSASVQPSGENVELQQTHNVDNKVEEPSAVSRQVTLQMGDGQEIQVKIERETEDTSDGEVVGGQIDDVQEEDDGDDDFETTGIDFEDNAGGTSVQAGDVSAADRSIDQTELPEDGATPKGGQRALKKCKYCEKMYASAGGLRKHIVYVHSQEKKFKCNLCSAAYYFKYQLRDHNATVHFPVSHSCKQCGMCFTKIRNLRHHMRYHLEEKDKRYRCGMCPKAYHYSRDLKRHMEIHMEKEICVRCNKPFVHMQLHLRRCGKPKQYTACEICGKIVQKRCLKDHMDNVHAEVGRHVCSTCGMRFRHRSSMERHYIKCTLKSIDNDTEGDAK